VETSFRRIVTSFRRRTRYAGVKSFPSGAPVPLNGSGAPTDAPPAGRAGVACPSPARRPAVPRARSAIRREAAPLRPWPPTSARVGGRCRGGGRRARISSTAAAQRNRLAPRSAHRADRGSSARARFCALISRSGAGVWGSRPRRRPLTSAPAGPPPAGRYISSRVQDADRSARWGSAASPGGGAGGRRRASGERRRVRRGRRLGTGCTRRRACPGPHGPAPAGPAPRGGGISPVRRRRVAHLGCMPPNSTP
jgi:hypothetical protein